MIVITVSLTAARFLPMTVALLADAALARTDSIGGSAPRCISWR